MKEHRAKPFSCKRAVVGGGGFISKFINKTIDALPVELHLPGGYQYCGAGTRLQERLARGDKGINGLDEACRLHDIEYSKFKDSENRRRADQELAERAWRRFKSSDSSFGEKASAWAVTTAMKAKVKIGGGKKKKGRKTMNKSKKGGALPLLPLLAGLSALGSLAGGASAVAKVVSDSKNARKNLDELKRHNLAMEGKGIYLRPYKGRGKKKRKSIKKKKTSSR